tara:strand:+ start:85 stop:1050 length:966 start_codon:yes stop_codon:yes gene_type:complete
MYKTPLFWKKKSLFSFLLLPFSFFYYLVCKIYRLSKKEVEIGKPVLCVGNLVIGGAGKTPLVIKIRQLLNNDFSKIFVLTRGYLGKEKGPLIVKKGMHYQKVGDESLIHANFGPTCISKNKIEGAKFCKKNGADLILLDDGLQSINIKKKTSLLVIDSSYGIENRFLFPSGPLRQPINDALKLCDAVIILDKNFNKKKYEFILHKNIFAGYRELKFNKKIKKKVIAFSALGNNQNFFESLLDHEIKVDEFFSFPDHHKFSITEIKKIIEKSDKKKLSIVCTRKDFIKVPDQFKKKICVADLNLRIKNSQKLREFILKTLKE